MKTTTLGLCTLLFFSCTQEDFPGQAEGGTPCDYICFGLSPDGVAQTRGGARADADGYTSGRFVLRSADSADTLCVRTVVTDGIAGAEKAVTRGTPVSDLTTYGTFHVVCDRDDMPNAFFMDVDVTEKSGGLWGTEPTYYWPGAGPTLTFYAWAPGDVYTNPTKDLTFTYTVPDAAADQKDLLVAKTAALDGDYHQAVDLAFDHICTAVKFVVGSEMQAGTIESVTLKGVYNKGTYDMTTAEWDLTNSPLVDFTQTLDIQTDGNETDGTAITTGAGTLMMLPQTLPDGATVEVVFHDNVTGTDRTLSATIEGSDWPQGKTVTYKLSVTPEYNMSIECVDKVDAHVDIQEIQIKADCAWTLSSDVEWVTFTDWSYDTSKPEERPLGHRGYWIRSERGTQTFSGTGDMTLYAYYDEHLGDQNRTATLSLTYEGKQGTGVTKTVTQYCPAWSGNAGYERFEEDHRWEGDSRTYTYPFGFAWNRKVTFTAEPKFSILDFSFRDLLGAYVFRNIANDAINQYDAGSYVTVEETKQTILFWEFTVKTTVTIDYSNFRAIGDLVNENDGLTNTRNLYGFQNIGQVSAIENVLRDNAVGTFSEEVTQDSHPDIAVDLFAARRIAMKNEFTKVIRESTEQGETIRYAEAVIDVNDIHWYLPASSEQVSLKSGLTAEDEPLEGVYWSSTAVNDNVNAYTYTPDGSTQSEDRMVPHKMRAAVRKTN